MPLLVIAIFGWQCVKGPTVVDDTGHAPDSAVVINENNFDSLVTKPGVIALVEFYQPGCGICQGLMWVIDSLAVTLGDSALIGAVNVDSNTTLYPRFGVTSVPSYLFFRDGVVVTRRSYSNSDPAAFDTLAALLREIIAGTFVPDTADTTHVPDSIPAGVAALDTANFELMVKVPGRIVMVDFFSPLCGLCRAMDSVVVNLAARFEGQALIGKVDIDVYGTLRSAYNVSSWPTFVFFDSGVEYARVVGVVPEDSLAAIVEQGLNR